MSDSKSRSVAINLAIALRAFLKANPLGTLTDGAGFIVSGQRYAPALGFVAKAGVSKPPQTGWKVVAPDLAVEIISSSDPQDLTAAMIANYLAAGATVWAIYPDTQEVEVHSPGKQVEVLDGDNRLDGGNVLPGFSVTVKEIFAD